MENNNLNALRILYIIKGILSVLGGLAFFLFFGVGASAFKEIEQQSSNGDFSSPEVPFILITGIFGFIVLLMVAVGILNFFAAKFINERKNHTFIFVMAIVNCLSGILGIALGIFTIIEIQKVEIKQLFSGKTV